MKINWTQLASILTNVAVVIGLALVWLELQQNSTQLRVDSQNNRIDTRIDIWFQRAANEEWRSGHNKIRQQRNHNCPLGQIDGMTPIEIGIVDDFFSAEMIYWQNLYYQRENGVVDAEQIKVLDLIPILSWRPYRERWRQNVQGIGALPAEFEQHVIAIADRYDAELEQMLTQQRAQGIVDPYGGDKPPCAI